MLVDEEKLIGWICIARLCLHRSDSFFIPDEIKVALEKRGWCKTGELDPDDGKRVFCFTPAGEAVCDLWSPEWGIDSLQEAGFSSDDEEE